MPATSVEPFVFCGARPEELALAARGVARWNKKQLTYCWLDPVPGLTQMKRDADSAWVWKQWSNALNGLLTFEPTSNSQTADILLTSGRIDRPGQVLAWMELPPGDDRQLRGRFDTQESWDRSIIFKLVMLHEMGHALGLDHIDQPGQPSVLDSMYNARLGELQPLDLATVRKIYPGWAQQPVPAPTPPAGTPGTPNPDQIVVQINALGSVYHGTLAKLL